MKYRWLQIALMWTVITGHPMQLFSQSTPSSRDSQRLEILHADDIYFETINGQTVQKLIGNVKLYQDSTFILLDSAIILDEHIDALGHIIIMQGDSTNIYADTLIFEGDKKMADLFGEVVLEDRDQKLFTTQLHYDIKTKIGTYYHSALLTNGKTHLKSKKGRYYVREKYAYFNEDVIVLDSSFVLTSDSVKYQTVNKVAYFIAPTKIVFDSSEIYCEGGYFEFDTRDALFHTNAIYIKDRDTIKADSIYVNNATGDITLIGHASVQSPDKNARAKWILYNQKTEDISLKGNAFYKADNSQVSADEIYYNAKSESFKTQGQSEVWEGSQRIKAQKLDYDKETGLGIATGNVVIFDTASQLLIHTDTFLYNRSNNFMKTIGNHPWIVQIMDEDSLFISADTFMTRNVSDTDSSKMLLAFNNVKIYKDDLQGVCDSLVYLEKDSIFKFFHLPILWSDTSQFSGDTIFMHLKNKQTERIDLRMHSFIVNSVDEILFNQIKGKRILTYLKENKPYETFIYGNAETLYFPLDDAGKYIGGNKTICSEMKIKFVDGKIDKIYYFKSPNAEMIPMVTPGIERIQLDGFQWKSDIRPLSREAIIRPNNTKTN